MFLGFRKPLDTHPKLTFPIPEPNGNGEVECVEEEELLVEFVPKTQQSRNNLQSVSFLKEKL